MTEFETDIHTAAGAMNTFVVHPEEGGPHPLLLFFMDAPGMRGELHDMARRLASVGYAVLLPNLYYRRSRDYKLRDRSEAAMAEMFGHMNSLDAATTRTDTAALLAYADTLAAADARRVGAVGYCMGGPFVVWAAAAQPQRILAIASVHGARMATAAADSPHRVAASLVCESYFACAEHDHWAPPADVEALAAALAQAAGRSRIEYYPGTQHGFVFPQREGSYDRGAAERHWERLFALFRRTLGPL